MQKSIKALALAVAMALSGAAFAADAPAPGAGGAGTDAPAKKPGGRMPGTRGKVSAVSITDGAGTITVKGRDGTDKTITVSKETKFTLDGEASDGSKVAVDMFVAATPAEGTATEVKVMTKAPTRRPKGDAPAKPADAPAKPADAAK